MKQRVGRLRRGGTMASLRLGTTKGVHGPCDELCPLRAPHSAPIDTNSRKFRGRGRNSGVCQHFLIWAGEEAPGGWSYVRNTINVDTRYGNRIRPFNIVQHTSNRYSILRDNYKGRPGELNVWAKKTGVETPKPRHNLRNEPDPSVSSLDPIHIIPN